MWVNNFYTLKPGIVWDLIKKGNVPAMSNTYTQCGMCYKNNVRYAKHSW